MKSPHLHVGWSKWSALRQYIEKTGLAVDQVLAIGDGLNDLEMVSQAGVGVAMGNAKPAVLEAADFVALDHDSDGVAQVLEAIPLTT